LGVGAIGAIGLGLTACTSNPAVPTVPSAAGASTPTSAGAPAGTATPAAAAPKYGGMLRSIGTTAERNLDPHVLNGGGNSLSSGVCYSQLLMYKWGPDVKVPSYVPTGDLAESWDQPDDLTYSFKLRPGVKWQNLPPVSGRELVADDIVFSLGRLRDLRDYAALLAGIARTEAVDRQTVKITMDRPNADLLVNLAAIQAKIVAREAVAVNGNLEGPPVIGTGPWLFQRWTQGGDFAATRNPDFFRKGVPYADGLETFRTADASAPANAFRGGRVNVLGSGMTVEAANDILKSLPNTRVVWMTLNRTPSEVALKATAEPFTDVRVRQAIAKAIDRKAIIETIHLGRAIQTSGITVPDPDWELPEAELNRLLARDLEGAKRLLREAGKESGFDMEMIAPTYLQRAYVTMAELIQANLREVGIRVTLKVLEAVAFQQQQAAGNYQSYIGARTVSSTNNQLYSLYYTGGPQNSTGYDSPELNRLIDQQAVLTRDLEARKRILQDLQRRVVNDAIIQTLHYRQQPILNAPEVMAFHPPAEILSTATDFWQTAWIDK
jgi:ABC-type transport system substrate-binding protein